MTIFSRHPYSFLFGGAGVVLFVVLATLRLPPQSSQITIVSLLPVPASTANNAQQSTNTPLILPGTTTQIVTPPTPASTSTTPAEQPTQPLVYTSSPNLSTNASSSASLLEQVYSLIPSQTLQVPSTQTLTPEQQALHDYGNEAGLAILTFENNALGMTDALKQWLAMRGDATAKANVIYIVSALNATGHQLRAIPDIPAAASSTNLALAASYEDAATKLQGVFDAGGDDAALIDAIKAYDTAADATTQRFLQLSDLLGSYGVAFGASEPGGVFAFPASGSTQSF
jgi:hypothetical protein